jgi:hypothetical protein
MLNPFTPPNYANKRRQLDEHVFDHFRMRPNTLITRIRLVGQAFSLPLTF